MKVLVGKFKFFLVEKGKAVFFWMPLLNRIVLSIVIMIQPFLVIFLYAIQLRPARIVHYLRFPLYILDNKPTQYINLAITIKSDSSRILSKLELMELCDEHEIPVPEWCYLDDVTLNYPFLAKTDHGIKRVTSASQLQFMVPKLTVLQKEVRNPVELSELCGSERLATCRVVTLRNPKNGKIEVLQGWHRYPFDVQEKRVSITDRKSFCIGHFDKEGRISVLQCDPGFDHYTFDNLNHPTTMSDVNDCALPWGKFQNFALQCHKDLTPNAFIVAWDLAFLDYDENAKGLVGDLQREIVLLDKVLAPPLYEDQLDNPDAYYLACRLKIAKLHVFRKRG